MLCSSGEGGHHQARPSAHSIQRIRALFGEGKEHPQPAGTAGSSRASSASGTPKTSFGPPQPQQQHPHHPQELIYFPPGTLNHASIAAALSEHGGGAGVAAGNAHQHHAHSSSTPSAVYSESVKEGWLHVKISSIDGKVQKHHHINQTHLESWEVNKKLETGRRKRISLTQMIFFFF